MSRLENTSPDVLTILAALCDDTADQQDVDTLEDLVGDDGKAVGVVLDFLQMHSDLHFELTSRKASANVFQGIGLIHNTVDYSPQSVAFSYLVATVLVGIGLLVASFMPIPHSAQVAQQPTPPSTTHYPLSTPHSTVGRITGMVDCQWADSSTEAFNGANVPLSRKYALASGLMEITYDTGAKVILQGPCTYEVESKSGGFLSVGKLTARVEKKAEGGGRKADNAETLASPFRLPPSALFSVRTPTAIVTDLGTEFGVEVDEAGQTASYVFRGSIRVQAATVGTETEGDTQVLHENESARVTTEDRTVVVGAEVNPSSFVRAVPKPEPHNRLRVLAHFRLGEDDIGASSGKPGNDVTSARLGRVIAQKVGSPHYVADVATPGSTLGIAFSSKDKQAYSVPFVLTAETDNVGIEAWVKPSTNEGDGAITWNGDMGWGLLQRGNILCGHLNGVGDIGAFAFTPGQWYHMALVRNRGVATLYINGTAVATDAREPTIPWGRFWIGCTEEKYYFNGAIDEVRVFEFKPGEFCPQDLLVKEAEKTSNRP